MKMSLELARRQLLFYRVDFVEHHGHQRSDRCLYLQHNLSVPITGNLLASPTILSQFVMDLSIDESVK